MYKINNLKLINNYTSDYINFFINAYKKKGRMN